VTGLELTRARGNDYGRLVHEQKVALLREPLGRVLDVGCASGANAEVLRRHGATHLTGIDSDEAFAAEARSRYDEVVHGWVPDDLIWPAESFDTVLAYDVLEHLYDPWGTVKQLAALLKPGGQLHVSLPNARSKKLWLPLLLRGTFAYEPEGIMDVTHLRFFTRRDAIALVEQVGLQIVSVDHPAPEAKKRQVAYRLGLTEFLTIQWYVLGLSPRE
jgi:2-polyprenyl-3-methyl-5-hydroxy-6-metoxy-1,4-benzoquinol methylase